MWLFYEKRTERFRKAKNKGENMEFNKKLDRLEEILEKLELGKMDVDQAVKLYEEANGILKNLHKQVAERKSKVNILKKELDKMVEEEFED